MGSVDKERGRGRATLLENHIGASPGGSTGNPKQQAHRRANRRVRTHSGEPENSGFTQELDEGEAFPGERCRGKVMVTNCWSPTERKGGRLGRGCEDSTDGSTEAKENRLPLSCQRMAP